MKIATCFFFAFGLLGLEAEMVFKTKLVEIKASADAKVVIAEFPFDIKGAEGAQIISREAPCTCLSADVLPRNPDRSAKLKWAEGETGKIVGRFEMGNFKGTVDKAILLKIRGQEKPVQLVVRVTIPVLFAIEPSTHKWEVGGALTPKVFKIKVNHSEPIHILKTDGQMDDYPYEVKTIKDGWEYEVTVTPKSTQAPGMGRLAFFTDCKIARHKRHQVFTVIRIPRK
ncbi:DUF1573 domain-containing protein [Akkermansiaceae bacterium]|nr:DUF1573 domain-containing protein [Akkermansiaceae bacterium]